MTLPAGPLSQQPVVNLPSLRGTTMVVRCTIGFWRAVVKDKVAAATAAQHTGADPTRIGATKQLIERDAIKPFQDIYNAAKATLRERTLPWKDDGVRIIRSQDFIALRTAISAYEDAFKAAYADFAPAYPSLREQARQGLGPLYDPNEFPHPDHLARRFYFSFTAEPLPTVDDWRVVGLSDADLATLRQQTEQATLDAINRAQADAWSRLRDAIGKMAEKLQGYSGGKQGAFRDSLVTNVAEIVDLIPSLNLTDDPRLTAVALAARGALLTYTPDDLREDADARQATAEAADQLVAAINQAVGTFI